MSADRCDWHTPVDFDLAVRELARARQRRDDSTRATVDFSERLAHRLTGHLSAEEYESVGRALIVMSTGLGALVMDVPTVEPTLLVNLLSFTGQRLVVDAVAAEGRPT